MKPGKPLKNYVGSKEANGVYQRIINQIRPHKTLIVPFAGNCAITRYIKPAENTILIDKDPRVIEAWLRYLTIKKDDVPDSLVLNIINDDKIPSDLFCKVFKSGSLTLFNDDAFNGYLQKYRYCRETVIYCDPPYLIERNYYKYNFTRNDHITLLKLMMAATCDVLINSYENDLYYDMLKDWNCIKYKVRTRKSSKIECLFMNYENKDGVLHDYSYLGKNFRERERIKKKINRHYEGLLRLNPLERNAILEKLKYLSPA
jgi:site-specific DNA-adenine methylase